MKNPLRSLGLSWARWRTLAVAVLMAALLSQGLPARAADGSLVLSALQVLEQHYAVPVHPADLLNAALATLRAATHESTAMLPDIPSADTEQQADAQFLAEFSRAAQAGPQSETQLAYAATQGMLQSLHDSHTYFLQPAQLQALHQQMRGGPAYTGIGIRIIGRTDSAGVRWVFVEDVMPGSPAEAAGIQRFDCGRRAEWRAQEKCRQRQGAENTE